MLEGGTTVLGRGEARPGRGAPGMMSRPFPLWRRTFWGEKGSPDVSAHLPPLSSYLGLYPPRFVLHIHPLLADTRTTARPAWSRESEGRRKNTGSRTLASSHFCTVLVELNSISRVAY